MREKIEEYLSTYGATLREKRKRIELSQLQVAHLLNVSQAIISHIETGHMLPPIELEEALIELYASEGKRNEQTFLL